MRSVKARGRRRPTVVLDALAGFLSFGTFLAVVSVLTILTLLSLKKESPAPLSLIILGDSARAAMGQVTRAVLANSEDRGYVVSCWIEAFKDGSWRYAPAQTAAARLPDQILPKAQYAFSVPAPQEGSAWRLKVTGRRTMGASETALAQMFGKIKLKYPFAKTFKVDGPEVVIRRNDPLPADLGTGGTLSAHREVR